MMSSPIGPCGQRPCLISARVTETGTLSAVDQEGEAVGSQKAW